MNINNNPKASLLIMCVIMSAFLWLGCSEKKHYTDALSPQDEIKHLNLIVTLE